MLLYGFSSGQRRLLRKVAFSYLYLFLNVQAFATQKDVAVRCPKAWQIVEDTKDTEWDKPLSFPSVDPKSQAEFESSLSFVALVPARFHANQCYRSCVSFAYALMYSFFSAPQSPPFSGGYLTARTFQVKFAEALSQGKTIVVETLHETKTAIEYFGLLTEADYPSRSAVNTRELATVLNKIVEAYRPLLRHANLGERNSLSIEAQRAAAKVIEKFFGRFPSSEDLTWRGSNGPIDQWSSVHRDRHFFSIDDYHVLSIMVPFLLERSIPILIDYDHYFGSVAANGMQTLPTDRPLAEYQQAGHAALITGLARSKLGHDVYYQVLNAHANAPVIYLSDLYLAKALRKAKFLLTEDERREYSEISGIPLYLPY